jgi:hypothetical protein
MFYILPYEGSTAFIYHVIRPTICTFCMYFTLKTSSTCFDQKAVHSQKPLFTVYADIGTYRAEGY